MWFRSYCVMPAADARLKSIPKHGSPVQEATRKKSWRDSKPTAGLFHSLLLSEATRRTSDPGANSRLRPLALKVPARRGPATAAAPLPPPARPPITAPIPAPANEPAISILIRFYPDDLPFLTHLLDSFLVSKNLSQVCSGRICLTACPDGLECEGDLGLLFAVRGSYGFDVPYLLWRTLCRSPHETSMFSRGPENGQRLAF